MKRQVPPGGRLTAGSRHCVVLRGSPVRYSSPRSTGASLVLRSSTKKLPSAVRPTASTLRAVRPWFSIRASSPSRKLRRSVTNWHSHHALLGVESPPSTGAMNSGSTKVSRRPVFEFNPVSAASRS